MSATMALTLTSVAVWRLGYGIRSLPRRFWDWLADRLGIIESTESLAAWWYEYEMTRRAFRYVPRHSREERYDKLSWRVGWSHWDTQFWPTLVTTGDACDLVDDTTSAESYAR